MPALEATFGAIYGIAQSKNGDLFATDNKNHVVLKFEFNKEEGAWSNVTVIAGTGKEGICADGVLGPQSALSYPMGISLIENNSNGDDDSVTAILIANPGYDRVRQLDMSTQNITTMAGTGQIGSTGDTGLATAAKLSYPRYVHYDELSGDIFIVDSSNNRIRRVRDGIITTVVGKVCTSSDGLGDEGQAVDACLKKPHQFTVNKAGEWFIVDNGNKRIRKVDLNRIITTVAGGGTETGDAPATSVQLSDPFGIAFTSSGEMLVADYGVRSLEKWIAADS